MKIRLLEYTLFHHHSFIIKNSDENKHYVVNCHHGCPWTVHARRRNGDNWRITCVIQPHTCCNNMDDRKHPQLSSRFISQRLVNIIKSCPLMTVTTLIEVVIVAYGYHVKYSRAWWARKHALKFIYGDWFEAYERLSAMLHSMKAKNPGMHFHYVPKPDILGPGSRKHFFRAFWTFEQCVNDFNHCCDVLSIDDTFLTGNCEGTMLIAIGIDADHQLVPLAFAIVEENNNSWGWFLHLVRKVVVGPGHEICVFSNRHVGILNLFVRRYSTTHLCTIGGAHTT
jgi:hypothetical protein